MVTPNNEPWALDQDDGEWNIRSEDGTYMFSIAPQYANITEEQLKRLILCFNACTGIPDGALENACNSGKSIWAIGFEAGCITHDSA